MSDYVWCHGPDCHERKTSNRVRGVKGSKVLRTVKINVRNYREGMWNYFCDHTCLMRFMWKHKKPFKGKCERYKKPYPKIKVYC